MNELLQLEKKIEAAMVELRSMVSDKPASAVPKSADLIQKTAELIKLQNDYARKLAEKHGVKSPFNEGE